MDRDGATADTHNRHGESKRRHDGNGTVEVTMVGRLWQKTEIEGENRHFDKSTQVAELATAKTGVGSRWVVNI